MERQGISSAFVVDRDNRPRLPRQRPSPITTRATGFRDRQDGSEDMGPMSSSMRHPISHCRTSKPPVDGHENSELGQSRSPHRVYDGAQGQSLEVSTDV